MPRGDDHRKLDQIAALLHEQMTPSMLRIKILAAVEGIQVPSQRKEFLVLAARAGVGQARRYEAWKQTYLDDPNLTEEERAAARQMYAKPAKAIPPPIPALPEMEIGEDDLATAHYRLYDAAGIFLYTGVADNLKERFDKHKREKSWWPQVARRTVTWYGSRSDALRAEDIAIKTEHPIHNIQGTVRQIAEESAA